MPDILICQYLDQDVKEASFYYAMGDDLAITQLRLTQGRTSLAKENLSYLLDKVQS